MKWMNLMLAASIAALNPGLLHAGWPIGAEAAKARGIELPLAFGLSLQYLDQSQPLTVSRSEFSADGSPFPATVDDLENQDRSQTLRLDGWLFPFLNLYLLGGQSQSVSEGTATIPPGVFGPQAMMVPFRQSYDGDILGLGFTLAAAHQQYFITLDLNYSETDIEISDDDAKATVISPRLGWTGSYRAWHGSLWLGAMYQDLKQTLEVDSDFNGSRVQAVIEQEAEQPWNTILGANWVINPHFWLALEGGFGKREQWIGSLGYRF